MPGGPKYHEVVYCDILVCDECKLTAISNSEQVVTIHISLQNVFSKIQR